MHKNFWLVLIHSRAQVRTVLMPSPARALERYRRQVATYVEASTIDRGLTDNDAPPVNSLAGGLRRRTRGGRTSRRGTVDGASRAK